MQPNSRYKMIPKFFILKFQMSKQQEIVTPTQKFVTAAVTIHGNKFNYSNVAYKNNISKVLISCNIHGQFYQNSSSHLSGRGCAHCR